MTPTAGWIALVLLTAAPTPEAKKQPVVLKGTAVTLAEALKPLGVTFDSAPVATQVVVKADDGEITPILSDEASRALFQDKRLRNRRAEVQGLKIPGLPYVQVVTFKVEEDGKLQTPEYYCEICTIRVRSPQICPCCQGEMVLRMKPEAP
jgi:hypothetical protein